MLAELTGVLVLQSKGMLMNNEHYSLAMSIKKLLDYDHRSWRGMVKKYNGSGPMAEKYADNMAIKVKSLQNCYKF